MQKLEDRVVLVTGGQRGLGAAILREMAAEGATCVVNYPSAIELEDAEDLVKELSGLGVPACALEANIADNAAANALIAGVDPRPDLVRHFHPPHLQNC